MKHIGRLVNGLSLVAKEIVNRSQTLEAVKNGDFQTLIKKAIVSATDISSLTKGKVREVSSSIPADQSSSVVYFTESPAPASNHTPNPADVAAEASGGYVDPPVVRDSHGDGAAVDKMMPEIIVDSRGLSGDLDN